MITPVQKLAGLVLLVVVLVASAAGITWQVQDWRMVKRLAEQAGLYKDDLAAISKAAAQARNEQDKRLTLERQLAGQDQQHHQELSDAQRNQSRLRDRLATADVRLSVFLAEIQPVAAQCLPPPAPAAWFMEEQEPNLPQRTLNELSPSPTPATGD